jgi:hypothetical protein
MNSKFLAQAMITVAALGFASAASADYFPGLEDLIGARGSSAEDELIARGYAFVSNPGSAARWWNARTRKCVSVAVGNGRVTSVLEAPPADCGQGNASRHSASSGHAAHAQINDLVGTDAIHAFDVMTEWGFTGVDTFSSSTGDEIYGIYWKASSHECVQVNSRDNRVFSVNRVDHHPRCR